MPTFFLYRDQRCLALYIREAFLLQKHLVSHTQQESVVLHLSFKPPLLRMTVRGGDDPHTLHSVPGDAFKVPRLLLVLDGSHPSFHLVLTSP